MFHEHILEPAYNWYFIHCFYLFVAGRLLAVSFIVGYYYYYYMDVC